MNVFKCLDLEYRKTVLGLSREQVGTKQFYVCKKRIEAFSVVIGVLNSMSWIKREEVKRKLRYFIENGYDYDALASEFNISKKSAYVLISRVSKQFEGVIGIDTVGKIAEGEFDIEDIDVKGHNIMDWFVSGVREKLEVRESTEVDILECMQELTTLRNLTKVSIDNRLKKLDGDKLAHILYILQSDSIEYALKKELVRSYISGEIKKYEDLEVRLKLLYTTGVK